ncbi:unnamed protein product [Adineta ricciae]|nr:unnamed protein product [Adineta ricciae]
MKCLTENSFESFCEEGKYQLLLLGNDQNRQFITPIIRNTQRIEHCLPFYYYSTKPQTILLFIDYLNEKNQRRFLRVFDEIHFNGWILAKEQFQTDSSSFQIIFRIYRVNMTNLQQEFYVAFDQITIKQGICENQQFRIPLFFSNDQSTFDTSTEHFPTSSSSSPDESYSSTSSFEITIDPNPTLTSKLPSSSNQTTTTDKSPYEYSLKTILGLSIGLGIPATIGIVLSIIYLIQWIKQRKTRVIPIKQTNIRLKKPSRHHHHHHREKKKKTHRKRNDFFD